MDTAKFKSFNSTATPSVDWKSKIKSSKQIQNNFSSNDFADFESFERFENDLIESHRDLLDLLVLPDHESSGGPRYPSRIGGEAVV